MKKYILMAMMAFVCAANMMAQYTSGTREGALNDKIKWTFDGKTLTLTNIEID